MAGPPRLYVDPPFAITFTCVLLGCAESRTVSIENRGGGELAVAGITLLDDSQGEFSLVTDAQASGGAPISLFAGDALSLEVRYVPADGAQDQARLVVQTFDAVQTFHDAKIAKTEIHLAARVLATVQSQAESDVIRFAYTEVDAVGEAVLRLHNVSAADAILAVLATTWLEGAEVFEVAGTFAPYANPGHALEIPLAFRPAAEAAYRGRLLVNTNDPRGPIEITVLGTAIAGVRLVVDGPLDFGEVRVGETRVQELIVRNDGSDGDDFDVYVAGPFIIEGDPTVSLEPLDEGVVRLRAAPVAGGEAVGALRLVGESSGADFVLQVLGLAPELGVVDATLHVELVHGWESELGSLTLFNAGNGVLEVSAIGLEVGSSALLGLRGVPGLPLRLGPDASAVVRPFVTASALGELAGAVVIESDGVVSPIARLPLSAMVRSCAEGCALPHATPSCASGTCGLDHCDGGWHDTNAARADGCECQEERSGSDVGAVCSSGLSVGWVGDACSAYPSEVVRTGTVHEGDIDLYFARSEDGSGFCDFFSDSSATSVSLRSGSDNLALCAVIRAGGAGCGAYTHAYDPDLCGSRSYQHVGSWGGEDSRDVTAWVMRKPGAPLVCESYSLVFRGR
jgi:hypothetical protein